MTFLLIPLAAAAGLLLAPAVAYLVRYVTNDGYGRPHAQQPPRSHPADLFDPRSGRFA